MPRWSETSTQPKPHGLWTPDEWSTNIDVPRFGDTWRYHMGTPSVAERFSDMYRRTRREHVYEIFNCVTPNITESVYNPQKDMVYIDDKLQYVDPKTKEGHLIFRQPLNIENYIGPEIESISLFPPYPNITFDDTWECTEDSDGKRTYTKKKEEDK